MNATPATRSLRDRRLVARGTHHVRDPPIAATLSGAGEQWHALTLDFAGPAGAETPETPEPFRDQRLDVAFTHAESGRTMTVPGFFAADGEAADTGATSGSVWRVHLMPPQTGAGPGRPPS